ncbi:hypothetical protein SL053_000193 [Flavobacterium psychrophilum]|uniref:hypothetical protein n=1 Tax=Flavobacterium psychrophilum TaxID=96345 RepID=UPI000B7C2446|nr:hypothetical protein [Flavobacterium psychrophilum]EKT3963301.1 hypothetical protein [Flavobacterium psychrophilum]EKT4517026.1 hypothetical protein [Flavobacterium psychrophilum]ELY2016328.1 hypothetical protein [Flavobacterium psychrophilum]SNB00986.1 conserved hypothetical protein [Flavobacterium psychrophilum]SNB13626.1 conserved hypothetical protein [Flavobacterium psychrophilum]
MIIIALTFSGISFAQESEISLDPLFKVEVGLHGFGIAYELPLAEKFSIDLSTGMGGQNRDAGYTLSNNEKLSFFGKSEIKYFYNRQKRLDKKRRLANNAGAFIAFQTKFNSNTPEYGSALLNEIHWGKQLPLGDKILIQFHFGLGYYRDFGKSDTRTLYPATGLKFSYILF